MFVMGDNRAHSEDSRFHLGVDNGSVPLAEVVGPVAAVVWPAANWQRFCRLRRSPGYRRGRLRRAGARTETRWRRAPGRPSRSVPGASGRAPRRGDERPASRERAATSWPDFDLERTSVRVVLLDPTDRLLLFRTVDPLMARIGTWWELPGGGMESRRRPIIDTAVREVAEETGFRLAADQIEVETGGRARWRRNVTYLRRGSGRCSTISSWSPDRRAGPGSGPRRSYPRGAAGLAGHRWWSAAEVVAAGGSGERFFPGRLPGVAGAFLAGHVIEVAFERWN